jgi:hypothetical protein
VFPSYLKFRTVDTVHKPSDSEFYTPSSDPFRPQFVGPYQLPFHFTSLRIYVKLPEMYERRGSTVGITTSYGLDDRGVRVLVPGESRIFTSPCRPRRSGAHPTSHMMGTGGFFPRRKAKRNKGGCDE